MSKLTYIFLNLFLTIKNKINKMMIVKLSLKGTTINEPEAKMVGVPSPKLRLEEIL